MKRKLALFSMVSGLALGLALVSAPAAFAQEESDTIVVTGSRIHTDPLTHNQPVTQLGQEDLARTGLSSTADVLQRLPVSGGGLNTRNNNSGNIGNPPDGGGVGAGAAEVDLRFLGARRVLVLVDGQRWVSGTAGSGIPGSSDLNTIPSSMIDRIEVLQESASPIYGSDAIAGVVNIITRRRQDGLQASAQYGGYFEEGDGQTQDYSISYGFSPAQGTDIVIGANYQNQETVSSADRPLSAFPAPYATSCAAGGCSSGAVNGRIDLIVPSLPGFENIDVTFGGSPGSAALFDPAACVPTADPGFSSCSLSATNSFRDFTTPDRFNYAPFNYLLTPSERLGAFMSLNHEINNTTSFRLRASYTDRKSANQAAPLPLFLGQDAGNGTILDDTVIDATNPFNPFGFTLDPSTYSFIGRRMIEAGPRHFEQEVETWSVAATLQGQWDLLGRTWFWDANLSTANNSASQSFTGDINVARVQQALGPLAGCTGSCVPLNIFGGGGTITPEMLSFIGYTEHNSSEAKLTDFTFNLTGDLLDLPAGPLSVATGYEFRRVEGSFDPDPITEAGLTSDIPARSGRGEYDVNELYAELRVPIAADQPGIHMLEASLAGRVFDYSTFGTDSTVSAGLRWRPVEEVLFRGSWGQGFRAPSIGELFGGGSRFDATITDPCNNLLTIADANIRNNCIANGVPADGSYSQRNPQLPVFVRGTSSLQPETSESWNVGAVWRPSWLENQSWTDSVTFEVNYANISIDDAIQAADPNTVMSLCATTGQCSTISRSASGAVRSIDDPLTNGGYVETRAVDFTVNWTSPEWAVGQFSFTTFVSHLLEFTDGATNPAVSREGTERGSPSQGFPDWKSTTSLNWEWNDWGATLTNRYVSSLVETAAGNAKMGSYSPWDLQVRWGPDMFAGVELALGVNNLFDEETPGCVSCDVNNMDPSLYDVPGRFGYFRISYRN
ncbi:MAG: TonB-dependent receptor [Hyphomonadaceae bacterium]